MVAGGGAGTVRVAGFEFVGSGIGILGGGGAGVSDNGAGLEGVAAGGGGPGCNGCIGVRLVTCGAGGAEVCWRAAWRAIQ